jgi:hypothetical protein
MTKSKTRTKSTGEVFTPPELVDEIINKLYNINPKLFKCKDKIFLDPACGDGEFLRGVIRKLKNVLGKKFTKQRWEHIIRYQLLGVELMWDNTCDTVYYLLRSWELLVNQQKINNIEIVTVFTEGFELNESHTPEEINRAFVHRTYKDSLGTIDIMPQEGSDHYVKYNIDGEGWILVENIVRANSLTEWDFQNWCPLNK